jgi:salicylate 5-hydroxylase large subunit
MTASMPASKRKSSAPVICAHVVVAAHGQNGDVNALLNHHACRGIRFCLSNHRSAKLFACPLLSMAYDLVGKLPGLPFRHGHGDQDGTSADFRSEAHALQRLTVTRRHARSPRAHRRPCGC